MADMCIKPYIKGSSSSSGLRPKALSPEAEEWKPSYLQKHQLLSHSHSHSHSHPQQQQQQHVILTAPFQLLSHHQAIRVLSPVCFFSSYIHQGFIPCVQVYDNSTSTPSLMPATHDFSVNNNEQKIDDDKSAGSNDIVGRKPKSGRRCFPPPPPRLRKEWKPKNNNNNNNNKRVSVTTLDVLPSSTKTINTTVMIKNIPNQLRSDYMLKFIDQCSKDHSLQYDFMYLPMDFIKKYNLGYAFVNFTSASSALRFKKIFQNFKWGTIHTDRGSFTSKKVCEITYARIQGKENLIKRFQQSIFRCDKMDFLPLLLDPPRNGLDANPSPPITLGTLHPRS